MSDTLSKTETKRRLQDMDEYEFEHLVAELWDRQGYQTSVSRGSGDRGIDVEARKEVPVPQKVLIQAKRYSDGNKVGANEARAYATLYQQVPDADTVVIVTTSRFTEEAERIAGEQNVKIIDIDGLLGLLEEKGGVKKEFLGQSNQHTNSFDSNSRFSSANMSDEEFREEVGEEYYEEYMEGMNEYKKTMEKADEFPDVLGEKLSEIENSKSGDVGLRVHWDEDEVCTIHFQTSGILRKKKYVLMAFNYTTIPKEQSEYKDISNQLKKWDSNDITTIKLEVDLTDNPNIKFKSNIHVDASVVAIIINSMMSDVLTAEMEIIDMNNWYM